MAFRARIKFHRLTKAHKNKEKFPYKTYDLAKYLLETLEMIQRGRNTEEVIFEDKDEENMEDYYTDPNEFDLKEAPIIFED